MPLRIGHHHGVDQNARNPDRARRQAVDLGDPLDLDDHQTAGVLGRHGHGQVVQGERLALHGDVAGRVGGRAADQRHLDRERPVEQPLLPVDLDEPDQVLRGHRVDLAAVLARVDEGAEPDPAEQAGFARGDVAVEVRDAALREVVGLDLVLQSELADARDQPPVPADHAPQQTVAAEPIQALPLAVPLPGGEDEGEVSGFGGLEEPPLQTGEQRLGNADTDETRRADGVPAVDEGDRILQRRDLVALLPAADAAFGQPRVGHERERTVTIVVSSGDQCREITRSSRFDRSWHGMTSGAAVGDVQRRAARLRTPDARQSHAADAERLPVAVPARRRHLRLGIRARVRIRDRRRAVRPAAWPRASSSRSCRPAGIIELPAGYLRRLKEMLRRTRHAAHRRRGADRPRPHRYDVRVRAGRDRARCAHPVEDTWRRPASSLPSSPARRSRSVCHTHSRSAGAIRTT